MNSVFALAAEYPQVCLCPVSPAAVVCRRARATMSRPCWPSVGEVAGGVVRSRCSSKFVVGGHVARPPAMQKLAVWFIFHRAAFSTPVGGEVRQWQHERNKNGIGLCLSAAPDANRTINRPHPLNRKSVFLVVIGRVSTLVTTQPNGLSSNGRRITPTTHGVER